MAKLVGNELPDDAVEALKPGNPDDKKGRVVQMITVNSAGWPDAGMLSYADVIARDRKSLRLATWGDGECANDMRNNGKIALLVIDYDMAYYVKGTASEIRLESTDLTDVNQEGGESPLAFFRIEVREVYEDRVPTARVLSGVKFEGSEVEEQAHEKILRQLLET
jgi:Pyridoxamine 5'-phosphate oxidase